MYYLVDFTSAKLVYPAVFKFPASEYYRIVFNRTLLMFGITILGMFIWKQLFPHGVQNMFIWFVGAGGIGFILLSIYLTIYYLMFEDFREFFDRIISLLKNRIKGIK